jgi:hypothetical protein
VVPLVETGELSGRTGFVVEEGKFGFECLLCGIGGTSRYPAGRLQCRSELMAKELGAIHVEVIAQLDNIIGEKKLIWTRVKSQTKI